MNTVMICRVYQSVSRTTRRLSTLIDGTRKLQCVSNIIVNAVFFSLQASLPKQGTVDYNYQIVSYEWIRLYMSAFWKESTLFLVMHNGKRGDKWQQRATATEPWGLMLVREFICFRLFAPYKQNRFFIPSRINVRKSGWEPNK